MTSLAQVDSELEERIRSANRISLFLDFDGTLVPIATDPASPRLDANATETLKMLLARDSLVTTILSGRAVEDLYGRIKVQGLIYAGNHGLEIFGRNLRFVQPAAEHRSKQLERLCDQLTAELEPFAGAQVEFKGLTASIHYRRASHEALAEIQRAVHSAVERTGDLFRVNCGRKVFEIMPNIDWHKGAAVLWINKQLANGTKSSSSHLTVCLGDDTTDEEAFAAVPDAITIKVGNARKSRARYQLQDPDAVHEFLRRLAIEDSMQ